MPVKNKPDPELERVVKAAVAQADSKVRPATSDKAIAAHAASMGKGGKGR